MHKVALHVQRLCSRQPLLLLSGTDSKDANPELGTRYDEPELAVLLVACGIGIATGRPWPYIAVQPVAVSV